MAAKLRAVFAAVALVMLGLVWQTAPALAHDQLLAQSIESDSSGKQLSLRLSFSDNVLTIGSQLVISDAAGVDARAGEPTYAGREVIQPLKTPLPDGEYRGAWRVVSNDGHPIESGFKFSVSGGKPSAVVEAAPAIVANNSAAQNAPSSPADSAQAAAQPAPNSETKTATTIWVAVAIGALAALIIGIGGVLMARNLAQRA